VAGAFDDFFVDGVLFFFAAGGFRVGMRVQYTMRK
jgi:hypothetical protein